ncbi:DUF6226 family protein [Demequina activiva]|uniref:Uncharacterized protein n=1 Tax=Demequina activiva TaxID=1582364 RepID=A0A919Q1S2_9MICO|nr:DUF6226 family protein [Demequina activiva]GIG53316.1 hypothetical protein Dac01nite_00680 [Demequina activiva]
MDARAGYTRPDVAFPEYRDESGAVIPYGELWGGGSPPDDSYSRLTHPDRFEIAWTHARAIVDHLAATFDVEVQDGVDPSEGRVPGPEPRVRAHAPGAPAAVRRLVPRGHGAPLTVIETDHPGVFMYAGATLAALAPHCGCDACDPSEQELAGDLEDLAFAVASGTASEGVERRGVVSTVSGPEGSSEGWSRASLAERRAARAAMALHPPFEPWPRRATARD